MRQKFTILMLIFATMGMYAYVGERFLYNGVKYIVNKEADATQQYEVAVFHYDTSYVVIPDSILHNGRRYQVSQSQSFFAGNCALQHYTKVDYSQVQFDFTSSTQEFYTDVDIDTLILPPNSGIVRVGYYSVPNTCYAPMPGIHHIALSGAAPAKILVSGNDFNFSLISLDISSCPYTNIYEAIHSPYLLLSSFPNLKQVILPNTIRDFPWELTVGSESLESITIPDSLEFIGFNAFGNIAMDHILLGSKVRTLEPGWAAEWRKLKSITVEDSNPYFSSDDYGCLLSKNRHVLHRYPSGIENDTYEIPQDVDTIGAGAFSLYTLFRGERYNELADRSHLSITCPCSPIPNHWQEDVTLREVKLHSNVRCIRCYAFMGSSIRQIYSEEGNNYDFSFSRVENIYHEAFANSLLKEINLPASLRRLGSKQEFFYVCNVGGWQGGDEVFYPGFGKDSRHHEWWGTGFVFSGCPNLESVSFDKATNLEYIGAACFAGCPLLDSLSLLPCTLLHDFPPATCLLDSALTYVALPHEVEYIGYSAFYGCTSLQKIVCPAAIPIPIDSSVFDGVNKQTCELSVPAASIPLYQNAPIWKDFFNITSNGLTAIIVTSNDTIMGTVHGGGGYDPGVTSTISATAKEGYEFVGWSDGNTDTLRVIQVTQDSNLVAIFRHIEYHIDARPNDTTLGTVTGGGYYHFHDTVILAANIPGYSRFTGWNDGYRYPIRDLVVTQDCTLIANFEHYHVGPNTVRVTVQSEDPAKGYAIGGGTYDLGDTASVAGIANAGYVFKGWDDGNINNPRHVPLTQDTLFVALFRLETDTADTMPTPRYPLKAIPYDSTMGTVSGSGRYEEGTVVEITATPFDGYRIKGWNVEVTVSPTITFTMSDRPATVIAYFEAIDDALPMTPADSNAPDTDHTPYNILGQPVDETYHGIVIQNGQKRVQ